MRRITSLLRGQLIWQCLCIMLFISLALEAGLTEGYAVVLAATRGKKAKHIYFFGDRHHFGSRKPHQEDELDLVAPAEKQHDEFLEALEESAEFRGAKPMVIFYEKAPKRFKRHPKELISELSKSVKLADIQHVRVVDAEVRRYAKHLRSALGRDKPTEDYKAHTGLKCMEDTTFQDVILEMDALYAELKAFRDTHPTPMPQKKSVDFDPADDFYAFDWEFFELAPLIARFKASLQEYSIDTNMKLLYIREDEQYSQALRDIKSILHRYEMEVLHLSLFKQILECDEEYIGVIAGSFETFATRSKLRGDRIINLFRHKVAHDFSEKEHDVSDFLLTKEEMLHIFLEYDLLCSLLKKCFFYKSATEVALMRRALLQNVSRLCESNYMKTAKVLMTLFALCILIDKYSTSKKKRNASSKRRNYCRNSLT